MKRLSLRDRAAIAIGLAITVTALFAMGNTWINVPGDEHAYEELAVNGPLGPTWYLYRYHPLDDLLVIVAGLLIMAAGAWWLRRGRGGPRLQRFAATVPLATATPILVLPILHLPAFGPALVGAILVSVGLMPLGLQLAGMIEGTNRRRLAKAIVLLLGLSVAAAELVIPWRYGASLASDQQDMSRQIDSVLSLGFWPFARALIPVLIVVFPAGILAGRSMFGKRPEILDTANDEQSLGALDLAILVLTPTVACLSLLWTDDFIIWPIVVWLLALEARRLSLGPVVTLLKRTTRQRDLVVAATEAERAHIASDIHDYALQDLTMLVRRLDAAGDKENADAAREVAERLRVICGDLRLPVLDDLGVGPALEWLCERYERSVGHIALDRLDDEKRLPADEELAFFRVAQEAVANAVHHGAPPILVRYRGGGSWAELEVDDSGEGVAAGAAEKAEQTGHLGLLNMNQRAEAIGGELTIGRRPGGGTRVRLVWEGEAPEFDEVTDEGTAAAAGANEAAEPA